MTDNSLNNVQDLRNPSILLALDSIHRSLLLKNMQFEGKLSILTVNAFMKHKYVCVCLLFNTYSYVLLFNL